MKRSYYDKLLRHKTFIHAEMSFAEGRERDVVGG